MDSYRRVFKFVTPAETALERARELHVAQQISLWDALLLAACREAGVTRLYSEDLPGRLKPADIEVINPFA